jgi:hypothetical protein
MHPLIILDKINVVEQRGNVVVSAYIMYLMKVIPEQHHAH